ncbi:hypothetical protein Mgra_00003226 [Meloidogyne graminicola]|uniref:LIM zinc-binding domain-containing protein n=1 Tax=Meloidogyne graminicola TaxID=189291 RepID=A0A8S9ZVH4_9BILA|nr:hypothetical protein Mgra_00003226 [Meloidogyne graminicola]
MYFEDVDKLSDFGICDRCSCSVEILDNDLDRIYCEHCFDKISNARCAACHQTLTSFYVDELNKFWHVECFICIKCKKSLCTNGYDGIYYEVNGQAYHHDCCYQVHLYPKLASEFKKKLKDDLTLQKKTEATTQTSDVRIGGIGNVGTFAAIFTVIGTFVGVFYVCSKIGRN